MCHLDARDDPHHEQAIKRACALGVQIGRLREMLSCKSKVGVAPQCVEHLLGDSENKIGSIRWRKR